MGVYVGEFPTLPYVCGQISFYCSPVYSFINSAFWPCPASSRFIRKFTVFYLAKIQLLIQYDEKSNT